VGAEALEAALAIFVGLFRDFGRMTGALLSTDGPLEPSSSRVTGGASCWQAGQRRPLDEAHRQERGQQLQAGATRLELRCPVPDVGQKVRQATAKPGQPREPTVALLERAYWPPDTAPPTGSQPLSAWLSLPPDHVPPLRITWSHLTQGPQGELWGRCPKVPSDLAATVGDQIDTQDPHQTERVFGY
jgi:hypothetical protein